jgi:hypothetical protein
MGLEVIEPPVQSPKANSLCERLIGTLRRECLDWIIPLTEEHLRKTLRSWLAHYNRGRPHSSLGPGLPDPPLNFLVHFATPEASLRPNKPSHGALRPERASPRVQPFGPRRMTVVEFLRMTQVVEPVGSRSISSSHFGQARRRIDPSCVGHGWNRHTCQQRLWPHAGDEPLFAEHAVLAAQAVEFRALIRGQPVLAPPLVAVGLRHPSCLICGSGYLSRAGLLPRPNVQCVDIEPVIGTNLECREPVLPEQLINR